MVKRILKEIMSVILWIALIGGYFVGMQMLKDYRRQRNHDFRLRIQALERAGR